MHELPRLRMKCVLVGSVRAGLAVCPRCFWLRSRDDSWHMLFFIFEYLYSKKKKKKLQMDSGNHIYQGLVRVKGPLFVLVLKLAKTEDAVLCTVCFFTRHCRTNFTFRELKLWYILKYWLTVVEIALNRPSHFNTLPTRQLCDAESAFFHRFTWEIAASKAIFLWNRALLSSNFQSLQISHRGPP